MWIAAQLLYPVQGLLTIAKTIHLTCGGNTCLETCFRQRSSLTGRRPSIFSLLNGVETNHIFEEFPRVSRYAFKTIHSPAGNFPPLHKHLSPSFSSSLQNVLLASVLIPDRILATQHRQLAPIPYQVEQSLRSITKDIHNEIIVGPL